MFKDISQVYDYLFNKRGKKSSNQELVNLFNKYNNFHLKLKTLHIAGTNGKGSTVYYLASVLKDAGYKIGTFTSPHMIVHNDRIQINFEMISNDKLLKYFNTYYLDFEKYQLNMFEIDTFLSLLYFYEMKVDFAIIEVGIGGLLDSTNLIYPILSLITSIGLDHQDLLGNTIEEIAMQKLGIVKPFIPLICNLKDNKLKNLAIKVTNEKKSELSFVSKAEKIKYHIEELSFYYKGLNVVLYNSPLYQIENVSLVIEVIQILNKKRYTNISDKLMLEAIKKVHYLGRFEIINKEPYIILDGAHNVDGINQLIKTIKKIKNKNIKILYSACLDKNPNLLISKLLDVVTDLTITEFDFYRAYKKENIDLEILKKVNYIRNYREALDFLLKNLNSDDVLIITGSLYFISEIRKILK